MVSDRPKIAISRCLLGEAVRYDGRSKPEPELIEPIAARCEIVPVCPEVEAGLTIPRPPIQLVQRATGQLIARGRDDHTLDVSTLIQQQALHFIQQHPTLDAVLLQNRSPSCGVGDTPHFSDNGTQIATDDGLFTAALRNAYPNLLITTPQTLHLTGALDHFLSQLRSNRKPNKY